MLTKRSRFRRQCSWCSAVEFCCSDEDGDPICADCIKLPGPENQVEREFKEAAKLGRPTMLRLV